jgi:hypothetical protein
LQCPERSDALEYATARTLDVAQVPAYGIGLFQRLDHLFDELDAELKAAQDGLAREETNLASYTDQLAGPFEHDQALLFAQRELARVDRKVTHHAGSNGPPAPPRINAALDSEAAARGAVAAASRVPSECDRDGVGRIPVRSARADGPFCV